MCALKKIDKTNVDSKLIVQLVREIKIQTFLNHPNIVKMYTFFSDKTYIYLALELCFSGQLYNFLKKKRKVNEDMTKNIVQQICRALDYMHENEIIHRDLKP
jgi:serine/threonine protein kinase